MFEWQRRQPGRSSTGSTRARPSGATCASSASISQNSRVHDASTTGNLLALAVDGTDLFYNEVGPGNRILLADPVAFTPRPERNRPPWPIRRRSRSARSPPQPVSTAVSRVRLCSCEAARPLGDSNSAARWAPGLGSPHLGSGRLFYLPRPRGRCRECPAPRRSVHFDCRNCPEVRVRMEGVDGSEALYA